MIYAGILAGGTGTRMGLGNTPKQFLTLGDKPIIIHTVEKFMLEPQFDYVIIGVHADWVLHMEQLVTTYLPMFQEKIIVTAGGTDRNSTIENIITCIDAHFGIKDDDVLVTHDSVRPFVTLRIIQENIKQAQLHQAVDTVVQSTDTIVESLNGKEISNIPNRQYYYQGQTPQSFNIKSFIELFNGLTVEEKNILTDACKIFVLKGKKVHLVNGEYSNIKITTAIDLKIADGMIKENL